MCNPAFLCRTSNDYVDSFVLSESSLFVFERKIVIKVWIRLYSVAVLLRRETHQDLRHDHSASLPSVNIGHCRSPSIRNFLRPVLSQKLFIPRPTATSPLRIRGRSPYVARALPRWPSSHYWSNNWCPLALVLC